jgi:nitrite reductase/ring-hydroxylating ferredoxin subunit
MAEYVRVAETREIPPGQLKLVTVDGEPVALANVDGDLYAFCAVCPHDEGPLDEGELVGHQVICPWHFSAFDVRTGAVLEPPAEDDVRPYQVRVEGDAVYVRAPEV